MRPIGSSSITRSQMLRAPTSALSRNLLAQPSRTLATTPIRTLASQPPTPSQDLNEAQRYLASKAARKAQRAADPTAASARHASLYSQLFPALLRILAYGSTAYFGLHLLWNVLDRDEQTKLMTAQAEGLEATAKSLAEKVDKAERRVGKAVESTADSLAQKETGAKKRWYWPF